MHRIAQLNVALDHARAGQWLETEAASRAALSENPRDPEALALLGLAIAASGDPERAAPALSTAARLRPNHLHPCVELADALGGPGSAAGLLVLRLFRACLRLDPLDERLREACANWLLDHDDAEGALAILRDARETPAFLHLTGMALAEAGAFTTAAERFRRLVSIQPDGAGAWSNLGMMLKIIGEHDKAIVAHDRAVLLDPKSPLMRVNRAVTLLHAGHWRRAWPDYDARLRAPDRQGLPLSTLLPDISHLDDLRGVTILAVHEDGFGDTLHFMRYLPLLAERGARVLAWVPETLIRIVARLPGVTPVAAGGPPPAHDFHCPMFSLPRAFAATPETVPAAPYISPDPALIAAWSQRLPAHGFRVGIVWAGQARPWLPGFASVDRRRGVDFQDLSALAAIPGVVLVSLQVGAVPPADATWPPAVDQTGADRGGMNASSVRIMNPMPGVRDFADTAAIIANLDMVVSVDTSVVHLAGAMGKRVFMLDRYDNCWRWLHGRMDSPWYPSLTIFRQDRPLDWSGPLSRMTAAVAGLAAFNAPAAAPGHPFHPRELEDAA